MSLNQAAGFQPLSGLRRAHAYAPDVLGCGRRNTWMLGPEHLTKNTCPYVVQANRLSYGNKVAWRTSTSKRWTSPSKFDSFADYWAPSPLGEGDRPGPIPVPFRMLACSYSSQCPENGGYQYISESHAFSLPARVWAVRGNRSRSPITIALRSKIPRRPKLTGGVRSMGTSVCMRCKMRANIRLI